MSGLSPNISDDNSRDLQLCGMNSDTSRCECAWKLQYLVILYTVSVLTTATKIVTCDSPPSMGRGKACEP
jgi:hypothetical protein